MDNVDISVILPVKNGQRYLGSLLKAVFSQEIKAAFEVIIIDSGSTDKSLDIIREYSVKLYRIKEAEFNHGLTRNLGISKAQGKYIILLTQDAVPIDKFWMANLIRNLENDESVAGVYSRHEPHADSGILAQIRAGRFFTSERQRRESKINDFEEFGNLPPKAKYHFCNFDNVSSCVRKSVLEKIPFPKTDFAEDLEWSKKALEAGYKIVYEPDSAVYHSHDFSVIEWYKRNRVNCAKLHSLFGFNAIDNIWKLLTLSVIYILKDLCIFFRSAGSFKKILLNFYLIPVFSVSGALGQYRGIKDCYENTSSCS